MSERDKRAEGYNLKEDSGIIRFVTLSIYWTINLTLHRDPSSIKALRVPVLRPMELMVEASPR